MRRRSPKRLTVVSTRLNDAQAEALAVARAWMGMSASEITYRALMLYVRASADIAGLERPPGRRRRAAVEARMAALVAALGAANDP